ncbi:universal stress protein [Caballeronia sp. LZ065]|uniref:universal stress protein n=1 Tax=Caballeronia sp. LZ065 TaxID=3038571 RepID=UPI00285B730A|nr:universal stress protein [Caballeronia sp. LZ065]MDR5781311.1 universal stress protein [Caballeronia sp. LZ065]
MFNKLLVPLDDSPQSECVVDLVAQLASPAATVYLLCAVDPSYVIAPDGSDDASDGLLYPAAHAQTLLAQAILTQAATRLAGCDLSVEKALRGGAPADVIVEQARLLTAEIIVMGHHHLSRLRRWATPSTSDGVIDRSPCPVLIETRDKR